MRLGRADKRRQKSDVDQPRFGQTNVAQRIVIKKGGDKKMRHNYFNDDDSTFSQKTVANVGTRTISLSLGTIAFVLSMIFMTLKLCGKIDWSWVVVFLPLIIVVGINVIAFLIGIIIFIIFYIRDR